MGSGPETRLVGAIRRAILEAHADAWVVKVAGGPYQEAGIPDLIVCVGGRLVGLEVKAPRPGESPAAARRRASAIQLAQLERIRRAGGSAAVVLSVDEALEVVNSQM